MKQTYRDIKTAPMSTNFTDVLKSAIYSISSLTAFAIKLTARIIQALVSFGKVLIKGV